MPAILLTIVKGIGCQPFEVMSFLGKFIGRILEKFPKIRR
jgi:hypothetical protein